MQLNFAIYHMKIKNCSYVILMAGILIFLSTNCKKERDEPPIPTDTTTIPEDTNKTPEDTTQATYEINYINAYLNADSAIVKYEYLNSLQNITSVTYITYSGSAILKQSNENAVTKYWLNASGLIEYIIDSTSSKIDTFASLEYFENNYLKVYRQFYPFGGDGVPFNYYYREGYNGYRTDALSIVDVYDTTNVVDFIINPPYFAIMSLIHAGIQNTKLVKRIVWKSSEIATNVAIRTYSYILNANGLVIERRETYYPSHRIGVVLLNKDIKHYITYITYIIQ